ncbi:MAG: TIM barrel protein [bacterium]
MCNVGMVVARRENLALLERTKLKRAEFVVFERGDRESLREYVSGRGIAFSAHCPLFIPGEYPENPLLACIIDIDEERRRRAVALVRETMEDGAAMGAEYAVAHIQRPVHFSGDNLKGITARDVMDVAGTSCAELADLSRETGIPVLIENLFDNPLFHSAGSYLELLRDFPSLGFCLDIGHLGVDSRNFGFDFMEFVRLLAPHTRAAHLQNSNASEKGYRTRHWKAPVHPSQRPEDGWLDVPAIMRTLLESNIECRFNFEGWMDYYPSRETAIEGIRWASGLYEEIRNELMRKTEADADGRRGAATDSSA